MLRSLYRLRYFSSCSLQCSYFLRFAYCCCLVPAGQRYTESLQNFGREVSSNIVFKNVQGARWNCCRNRSSYEGGWVSGAASRSVSPVGTMTRLRAGIEVSMPPQGPTQPNLRCFLPSSPGVKRSEIKADHYPPYSCDVRNVWSCSFTSTCLSYRPKGFQFIAIRSCLLPSRCYQLYIRLEMVKNELWRFRRKRS